MKLQNPAPCPAARQFNAFTNHLSGVPSNVNHGTRASGMQNAYISILRPVCSHGTSLEGAPGRPARVHASKLTSDEKVALDWIGWTRCTVRNHARLLNTPGETNFPRKLHETSAGLDRFQPEIPRVGPSPKENRHLLDSGGSP